jgi:hypothetical protein
MATGLRETIEHVVEERNRLAGQGVRDRELLQQRTAERDEARALVKEIEPLVSVIADNHTIGGLKATLPAWLARARALLKEDGAE